MSLNKLLDSFTQKGTHVEIPRKHLPTFRQFFLKSFREKAILPSMHKEQPACGATFPLHELHKRNQNLPNRMSVQVYRMVEYWKREDSMMTKVPVLKSREQEHWKRSIL
jgi:hypothetical protein